MNVVILTGNLTSDPELKYTSQNIPYCRFTLANNGYKNKDGNAKADFISCFCSKGIAENLVKYQRKGNKLAITGRLHTRSYDKPDGNKAYATDVIVNSLEYLTSKPKTTEPTPAYSTNTYYHEPEPVPTTPASDPYQDFGDDLELSPDEFPFN